MKNFFSITTEASSHLEKADLKSHRIHYRSKVYTSNLGINSLIAAAHPLFSILERINLSEKTPEFSALQENLSHELHAFMTKVSTTEHTEEIILLARFLLCATIDEVIEKAYNKTSKSATEEITSLIIENSTSEISESRHSTDDSTEIYFFQIIDKAIIKPDFYLDLIELTYLCIITGFEGKYRHEPQGKQALENLLENLYHVIQAHKSPMTSKLFIQTGHTQRFATTKPFPWKPVTAFLVSMIAIGYFTVAYYLSQKTTELSLTSSQQSTYAHQRTY